VRHADFVLNTLQRELFPSLGARPVKEITAPELLAVVRKIESRDALELARKALQTAGQVFRFGVATGKAERDPSPDLRGALKTRSVTHMSRIAESEVPELMRNIAAYDGEPQTRLALELLALTFVRTAELRFAEWTEIDEKKGGVADTCRENEDARATHRAAVEAGARGFQAASGTDWVRAMGFSGTLRHKETDERKHGAIRAVPHGLPLANDGARLSRPCIDGVERTRLQ